MLPHLSYLSRTFQSGNLKFSRISPNIHVTKTKLLETRAENKVLVELDKDLGEDRRLSLCNITLPESTRSLIENQVKSYVEIISSNIDYRFLPQSLAIFEAFSIFDVGQIPNETNTQEFKIYGEAEINEIGSPFYQKNLEEKKILLEQWKLMKIEQLYLKKSSLQFKRCADNNEMKLKSTSTEWALHRIVRTFSSNENLTMIYEIAKFAFITPVTNPWPELGASAVKRVKTRFSSQMKDDLLNSLLMITVNGPDFKTAEYENLLEEVTNIKKKQCHKKHPGNFSTIIKDKKVSISTQTIAIDDNVDDQID